MGIVKKVFGASAIIILANGLNRLFAILAAPILTRVLGPAPFGVMALVGTATSLASTFSLPGVDMAYVRFYVSRTNTTSHVVERSRWRCGFLFWVPLVFYPYYLGLSAGLLSIRLKKGGRCFAYAN